MSSRKHDGIGQFLVYQTEDGKLKLDVRLEDETVWLSQKLMAELFQKDVRTINEHILNIYSEGELDPKSTIRKIRIVQTYIEKVFHVPGLKDLGYKPYSSDSNFITRYDV